MSFIDYVSKRGNEYYIGMYDLDGYIIDEDEIKEDEYLKIKKKIQEKNKKI